MTQPLPKSYGEIRWLDDMDPMAAETDSDLESLTQDVAHLITEELGSNLDDPNRGAGVINLLGADSSKLLNLGPTIDAQLEDDKRIDQSETVVSQLPSGKWQVAVTVQVDGTVLTLNYQIGPDGLQRA